MVVVIFPNLVSFMPANSIQPTVPVGLKVYVAETMPRPQKFRTSKSRKMPRRGGTLPLENLLQCFSREGIAVLEDVIEGMKSTKLSALFLMVDLCRCCLGQLQ